MKYLLIIALAFVSMKQPVVPAIKTVIYRNATLIDGLGGTPAAGVDICVEGARITAIGKDLRVPGATIVDLSGKTIMPLLSSTHMHIGTLKGTQNNADNYTRENILAQLKKYENYGVGNVLSMGSDRPMLFDTGLRDSSLRSLLPGARLYSAGYGFGVPESAPPVGMGMDQVLRPDSAAQVPAMMDKVASIHPALIKMWVDDFGGKFTKMDPSVYTAVIKQAHARGLRVASHLYYLSDARKLVAAGLDVMAHSIRDSVIDDALLMEMKKRNVVYIPTLSLDEYAYIYSRRPEWIDDAFFKASLEPGVYDMISSQKYQDDLKNSPDFERNKHAFETALINLKKIYDAGIVVSMGTDSGATPIRAQGFSEHLEMQLFVEAGLTPLQAITIATRNGARLLKTDDQYGTLQRGKLASFMVLRANPAFDIKNSHLIEAVYKNGVLVSNGPL